MAIVCFRFSNALTSMNHRKKEIEYATVSINIQIIARPTSKNKIKAIINNVGSGVNEKASHVDAPNGDKQSAADIEKDFWLNFEDRASERKYALSHKFLVHSSIYDQSSLSHKSQQSTSMTFNIYENSSRYRAKRTPMER